MLARHFHALGHAVTVLSRQAKPALWSVVSWNAETLGGWTREIEGADAVINLAGRSVDCRYNAANRRAIMDSRVNSTRVLGEAIAQSKTPPPLWMNASTATIYRHAFDRPMDERTGEMGGSEPGAPATWNFSIRVARSWEKAFFEAAVPGTRKVALRSAMIMGTGKGGVLDVLRRLVRAGLGGKAGFGRQYVSWIHEADFTAAVCFLMERTDMDGAVNVASPNPLPNEEFMRVLRDVSGVSVGLPAAPWMLEAGALVMRTETELILKSRRVVPGRLLEAGFRFRFPDWPAAARDLVRG